MEEGAGGDGGGGDGIDVATIFGESKVTGLAAEYILVGVRVAEPSVHLGAESGCFVVLEDGIVNNGAVVIEADEEGNVTGEAVRRRGLDGGTGEGGVLEGGEDSKGVTFRGRDAEGIVEGVVVVGRADGVKCGGQCGSIGFGDGGGGEVVGGSQKCAGGGGDKCKREEHIREGGAEFFHDLAESKGFRFSIGVDERGEGVHDEDGEGHAFRVGTEKADDGGEKADGEAIEEHTGGSHRGGDVIGGHEDGTQ
jgi:hypothetical protein